VPSRDKVWKLWAPIVPSNLRHTFVTLAGEVGRVVQWKGAGISRSIIAQTVGHRAGSTMTADHYDKLQVPSMVVLPIVWPEIVEGGDSGVKSPLAADLGPSE
jgi:integrase